MFTRLRDTIHILTYREPVVHGPDAIVMEKPVQPHVPFFGKFVANLIEVVVVIYGVGFIAGDLGSKLFPHIPTGKGLSLTTLVGALGALLLWLGHRFIGQLQVLLQRRLNLAEKLAPYFGHKMEETYRALRY